MALTIVAHLWRIAQGLIGLPLKSLGPILAFSFWPLSHARGPDLGGEAAIQAAVTTAVQLRPQINPEAALTSA